MNSPKLAVTQMALAKLMNQKQNQSHESEKETGRDDIQLAEMGER